MMNRKHKITVILTITLLAIPMILQTVQTNAQDVIYVTNYLYAYASPNPVGVGQTVYISLFFTKPLPPAFGSMFGGGVYNDLSVVVTPPAGSPITLASGLTTDTTGGVGGLEFVPDAVGEYQVQAFYPGEWLTGAVDEIFLSETESPISTFVVQEEQITEFAPPPLPTEYWSRPMFATNFNWAKLGGPWWGLGKPAFMNTGGYDASGNNFNAYSEAPNSAHIMWTKPIAFGGQPGEPIEPNQESAYTSASILYKQMEGVALNGIFYYDKYPNVPGARAGRAAIDIRTGETVWEQEYLGDTISFVSVLKFHTIQEYGSQAWLWAMSDSSPREFRLYAPMDGTYVATVNNFPSGLVGLFGSSPAGLVDTSDFLTQGSVLIHYTSGGNLVMWNSSLCLFGPSGTSVLRPSGNIDFQRGVQWEVPIPTTYNDEPISLGMRARTQEAIVFSYYPAIIPTFATEFGDDYAIDLGIDTKTGTILWGPVKRTLVEFNGINIVAAGEGYYVRHNKDQNTAYGYSAINGDQLWGPVQLESNPLATLARGAAIAYGNVYIWDFSGFVHAIDLETGNVEWTFTRGSAGYENPYGVYPIWHYSSHSIADGKLFLSESRMYDPPLFVNAHRLAINCTSGELVWSVLGFHGRNTGAISDGHLLCYNSYDAQIYSFGKGPTDTSAMIQQDVVTEGDSVLIQGMVTDVSAGTKDSNRIARFPDGVPAISDANMSAWMEYVYMQQAKPADAMGVDVTISVLDPNGNSYDVATATSDVNGFYSATFTPPVPGKYTVYATFSGSESYWPSSAVTALNVDSAPEPTAAPTATPAPMTDTYVLGLGAGSILAIIAIGLVVILMLRKR
jgi:hypothetical protein